MKHQTFAEHLQCEITLEGIATKYKSEALRAIFSQTSPELDVSYPSNKNLPINYFKFNFNIKKTKWALRLKIFLFTTTTNFMAKIKEL